MSYENPQLPEDVNVGRENPLLEFLRLTAGLAVVVAIIGTVLYFSGGWLARQIPFASECAWVGDRVIGLRKLPHAGASHAAIETYLQTLTASLAATMALPQDMNLRVHYADLPEPNAFASLGGHIVVTRGLYERMPSENALAMVLAHEIAHVRARDPIAGVAGSSLLILGTLIITGDARGLTGAFAALIQRGYSRRAETRADGLAIDALRRHYGHAGGGAALFDVLSGYRAEHGGELPTLLSTHPLDAERIARLQTAAADWEPQAQPLRVLAVPPAKH